MRTPSLPLLAFVAVVFAPHAARATTVLEISEEAMAVQADVITHGEAVSVESSRLDGQLVTLVRVEARDLLKGDAPAVTVVIPGGVDTRGKFPIATVYPGAPRIFVGQEVVLFLERNRSLGGAYSIMGFSQGVYEVVRDAEGRAQVARNLSDLRLVGGSAAARAEESGSSLEGFKARIRGHLSNPPRPVQP